MIYKPYYTIPNFWKKTSTLLLGTTLSLCASTYVSAMDLKTAMDIVLKTNPEIAEAAANRRAIDFEYEQAKRLSMPQFILEGRVGPEWVDSRTTRLLGNDNSVLFGRQASITMQKSLYSFNRNGSERARQASRVDAAAQRVWERSELIGLDVVQAYLDIMRLREILDLSDQNVSFHAAKVSEITRSVSSGIQSEADAQQARERHSAALIVRNETEEALEIADSTFRRIVGTDIGQTSLPQSVYAFLPGSLGDALKQARTGNPTLHIARADLDTARSEYKKSKADTKPTLFLEGVARTGEDISGFRDYQNDARVQLVFRYEFRGGIKSSAVQEHLNRTDEVRQRLMTLERNVESLVREAWSTRKKTSERKLELQKQVDEGVRLLDSYQREFGVNRRTLLDILGSQSGLFQAQSSHVTAKYADLYAQYRILASTGGLLKAFNTQPRREAKANLRALEGVEPTPVADTEKRRYPKHYNETMDEINMWAPIVDGNDSSADATASKYKLVEVTPVLRQSDGVAPNVEKPEQVKIVQAPSVAVEPVPLKVVASNNKPIIYGASTGTEVEADPVQLAENVLAETAQQAEQPIVVIPAETVVVSSEHLVLEAALESEMIIPHMETLSANVDLNPSTGSGMTEGHIVKSVDQNTFAEIMNKAGVEVYPKMNTLLYNNTLYLLQK